MITALRRAISHLSYPAFMLRVTFPGQQPIFVGPISGYRPSRSDLRALLEASSYASFLAANPRLYDELISLADIQVEDCGLYDVSCFASARHPHHFSCCSDTQSRATIQAWFGSARGRAFRNDWVASRPPNRRFTRNPDGSYQFFAKDGSRHQIPRREQPA
jgi:hypothetical protein